VFGRFQRSVERARQMAESGNLDEALTMLDGIAAQSKIPKQIEEVCGILTYVAAELSNQSRLELAAKFLETALGHSGRLPQNDKSAFLMSNLAGVCGALSRFSESKELYRQAIEILRGSPKPELALKAEVALAQQLGHIEPNTEEFERAWREAWEHCPRDASEPQSILIAVRVQALAVTDRQHEIFSFLVSHIGADGTEDWLRNTITASKKQAAGGSEPILLVLLAELLIAKGRSPGEVRELLSEASQVHEQRGELDQAARCLLMIAQYYEQRGNPERALADARRATEVLRQANIPDTEYNVLGSAAQLAVEIDLEFTEKCLQRRKELASLIDAPDALDPNMILLEADVRLKRGRYRDCLNFVVENSELVSSEGDSMTAFGLLLRAAAALVLIGSLDGAREIYELMVQAGNQDANAMKFNKTGGAAAVLGCVGLGICALRNQDTAKAIRQLRKAAEIVEGLHNKATDATLNPDIAERFRTALYRLASDKNVPAAASEKNAVDGQLLATLMSLPGLKTRNAAVRTELGHTDPARYETRNWVYYDHQSFWRVYSLITELQARSHQSKAGFWQLESARSLTYANDVLSRDLVWRVPFLIGAETIGGKPPKYIEWMESEPGTAAISYFIGENESYVWVLLPRDADWPRTFSIPGVTRTAFSNLLLKDWIKPYEESRRGDARSVTAFQENMNTFLGKLHELFFASPRAGAEPLLDTLRAVGIRRLVIIPHGALHHLPLHAARAGDGSYICDQFEVCYSPSSRMITRNLQLERNWGEKILVVSDPDGTLSSARQEFEVISPFFENAIRLEGERASVANVLAALQQANVVHFGCHGQMASTDRRSNGLTLSTGQFLSVQELLSDDKDVRQRPYGPALRLVFLAACESGLDVKKPYEEVLSLSTAFLAAGAPAVIGTLWQVSDESTSEFVRTFYTKVRKEQLPIGTALTETQKEIRKTWPHPWYWAPFVLLGSWSETTPRDLTRTSTYQSRRVLTRAECQR